MTWREDCEPGQITRWRPVAREIGMTSHGMLLYADWCAAEAKATGGHVRRKVENGIEVCALFEGREE